MPIAIAIDGPSGAGKSSISKMVAKELNFLYMDTGALYRTVALAVKNANIKPEKSQEIDSLLNSISIKLKFNKNMDQIVLLNETDVTSKIRTPEISMMASAVSAIPSVRKFLLNLQRDMAKSNNVIMDGRDIGTVVLPKAKVKIFLTASPEKRAERRYKELLADGMKVNYDDILKDVIERDNNDSNRDIAPLKPAKDSIIIDNTNKNLEESVQQLLNTIKEKM